MRYRLGQFLETSSLPRWRAAACHVVQALEDQHGPDSINSIEPIALPGGYIGIGTNHQRSYVELVGVIVALILSAFVTRQAILPALRNGWHETLLGLSFLAALLLASVYMLVLYVKAPGPATVLIVGPTGGYVAWRSRVTLRPRQVEFSCLDSELTFTLHTVTQSNTDYHYLRAFLGPQGSRLRRRLLFMVRLDDSARVIWLRFVAELPSFIGAKNGAA